MSRIVAALCAALLLQLVVAADVTSPESSSVEETKQCLLQQNSRIARSDAISDNLHSQVVKEVDSSDSKRGHNKHIDHEDKKHGKKEESHKSTAHKSKSHQKKDHEKSKHKISKKSKSLLQISVKEEDVPEHIMALGMKLFKEKDAVMAMIKNSVLVDVKHAGVSMKLRMSKDDDATTRLTEEGNFMAYDLGHMDDASPDKNSSKEDHENSSKGDLLNMIDIGGNYGVVTIAVMKTYAKKLRVVTLEPAPATFFFLRWNLHINGVPEIDAADWDPKKGTSGVLAMNAGSADKDGQSLHFCYYADSSMNSKMCDCKEGDNGCLILPSITIDDLGAKFDTQPIAMMKMDCEGCEFESLPALVNSKVAKRVQLFMGELHIPDEKIEKLACRWDHGRLVKKCQFSKTNPQDVECDVELDCPK